jgi:hypothetical protein
VERLIVVPHHLLRERATAHPAYPRAMAAGPKVPAGHGQKFAILDEDFTEGTVHSPSCECF